MSNLLLDTHVLLWWLGDSPRLSPLHRELLHDSARRVFVSSITVAEISIKASFGKLDAPRGIIEAITQSGFELLAFTPVHAEELRDLPWVHRDPFDRMLIAQARIEGLTLVTVDEHIARYGGFRHA